MSVDIYHNGRIIGIARYYSGVYVFDAYGSLSADDMAFAQREVKMMNQIGWKA